MPLDPNIRRPPDDPHSAMTPLISAYVVYACLFGLAAALAALSASQRARQWFFAQVWASGGGASRVDAKLRDAKRALLRGIAGRVLDVGSGEGVNLQYLAVPAVTEIVCIEPNPYLQKRLRAAARAVVEARRARRGPPLSVRVYAGTLCEYADEESLVEFDAIVCVLVLCSVTRLGAELAAAVRLLKAGGALYYVDQGGADSGPARRALLRAVQPLWSLLGGGFQASLAT